MTLLIGSLHLGLVYGLLALGIYVTFRILNTPDLTTEGSFTLGLAVSASMSLNGSPILGLGVALLAGAIAGAITGILQTSLRIPPILSGILTMSGLYSINLFILGNRSNIALMDTNHIFDRAVSAFSTMDKDMAKLVLLLIFCGIGYIVLVWFFQTHLGLCIRATGGNEDMVRSSSINGNVMRIIALAVSNAFVALSGAVAAQYQGYADIGSGVGMMVVGLASVIIGEMFFGRRSVPIGFLSAICGSLVYRFIIAIALKSEFFPAYALKLVSAIIVILALSLPGLKEQFTLSRLRREGKRNA